MCFALTPPAFYPPSIGERKKLVSILKRSGLTLTTARINLLHHLTQNQIPLTAFNLSELVNLPLSTVHRNLSMFADFGLVDFIVDRASVCRWFLVTVGRANYCPTCNQTFNGAY
ncbi:helix-turn-helix domain-containing protein [Escherichia coli]|uniref:helix-turn-helix domain-containing protein n=1 Tax=Escherichia coli TaxID=562 RepID=UPI0032E91958